ncbi:MULTISPECIES: mannose-6-phosphate isomerase, class I [Bacillus amyloliquefaciens group]|uniref:mannose-6-phosphate isomerase, class I n=1 Tax=Bacillus amyloliquefaciens group TaxID=1938374 RepID=UPI000D6BD2D4|nr:MULTISPECIES: mannose-6-phosphate isomerase, class I [Bacillus amyloliquefaciens group]AWM46007.1 mannose-6-phosphate isomerase, class I [Bacillus amyloliquefaciens]QZY41405.1 mannose-6-phosphate isomerase, class I [Bacillus velezensis]TWO87284.1 mannose-6-phosphate isomerase, class I [Bacillus velezensis]
MTKLLFLEPVFKERLWGGTKLRDTFGYEFPSERTGECWAISAHPHGTSIVRNGPFSGTSLHRLWNEHPDLFGHPKEEAFPLLTKILDANMDLSVQVHPDDAYAHRHENGELGKTECWYVLDCKKDAELILGHRAQTREDFVRLIERNEWDHLLRRIPIKPGDFFYVPSGTLHALCEGTLVLEIQQSSDATYRLYDYDRTDGNGNKRELHLQKAIDVTSIPHTDENVKSTKHRIGDALITTLAETPFFSVYQWDVSGKASFPAPGRYLLASVIKGRGELDGCPIHKGDHFIVPADSGDFVIEGDCEVIVSHPSSS